MKKKFLAMFLIALISLTGLLSISASAATPVNKKIAAPNIGYWYEFFGTVEPLKPNKASKNTYYDFTTDSREIVLYLDDGAKGTIYYKTSDMSKYKKYTKPFEVSESTTIKYYTYKNKQRSVVKTMKYVFATQAVAAHPATGLGLDYRVFAGEQDITFGGFREGSTVYYTLDGTKATKKSTKWNPGEPIHLSGTTKISVVAYHPDYKAYRNSYEFTIDPTNPEAHEFLG